MDNQRVLVVGSGGREHALAWALSRSSHIEKVYVAPGNGGTQWPAGKSSSALAPIAACENVALAVDDFTGLRQFALEQNIALTVVGPEVPLAGGIVDAFQASGLKIFGPGQAPAQLEASKAFAKQFMVDHNIPTAPYATFHDIHSARDYLKTQSGSVVVKASGLASGKGVFVCNDVAEAERALIEIFEARKFGAAGNTVLIEERLIGRELSVLAFADGETIKSMVLARDYKRALANDAGPNTGGMGAIAPVEELSADEMIFIQEHILQPVLVGMAEHGTPYKGILYAGLMMTSDGPRVLEYNCRFGDPETQVVLPLLKTELFEVLLACVEGHLSDLELAWHPVSCATVVLAAGGYPDAYELGQSISGLDKLTDEVIAFHAGTRQQDGQLVTSGGRVLAVTARDVNIPQALQKIYATIPNIHFEGMQYRTDIGGGVGEAE